MIEQIMYFALGVLIATLVALLVLPAVWHRAVRLTTKRVEAAVPVSMFEVEAEKDQQRAFFALNQRRLELRLDALRDTIVAHAATIEEQRRKIFDLDRDLGALTTLHQALEQTHAAEIQRRQELEAALAGKEAEAIALAEELRQRTAERDDLTAVRAGLKTDLEGLAATLAEREETVATQAARIAALEADNARLDSQLGTTRANLTDAAGRLEAEQRTLAEIRRADAQETSRLSARIATLDADLAARTHEKEALDSALETVRTERDSLVSNLRTTEADLEANRAAIHAFEQRRASEFAAAEAENQRVTQSLQMLEADHAMMRGALARARGTGAPMDGAQGGPEPLKSALTDLAAQVVALTAKMEGAASPIPQMVNGASAASGSDNLAGRIRALLADVPEHTATTAPSPGPAATEPQRVASA